MLHVADTSINRVQRRGSRAAALLLLASASLAVSGCTRTFWRLQADSDVYDIVVEKMTDPRWAVPRIELPPDAASRFAYPYDQDYGPLPPDDPAAHLYMHRPWFFKGYSSWHEYGTALAIENPHWLVPFGLEPSDTNPAAHELEGDGTQPLDPNAPPPAPGVDESDMVVPAQYEAPADAEAKPVDSKDSTSSAYGEEKPLLKNLTLPQALELAYIHSREYQFELENVYLQALQLAFERFQFTVRFLGIGGGEPGFDLEYTGLENQPNELSLDTNAGVSQLLPSGGQFAIDLANNTLFMFGGGEGPETASTLAFSIVQPLLFGAGRKIALESLTLSERDVLYSVRDLARFRKSFFTQIVATGGSGGFLGILQQRQLINNRVDNIRRLEQQIEILQALSAQPPPRLTATLEAPPADLPIPDGLPPELRLEVSYDAATREVVYRGDMTAEAIETLLPLSQDPAWQAAVRDLIEQIEQQRDVVSLEVAQLLTQLTSAQANLQSTLAVYQGNIDQYKTEIGLPTELPMSIDESMLKQFVLIDPNILALEQEIFDYRPVTAAVGRGSLPAQIPIETYRNALEGLISLHQRVRRDVLDILDADIARVEDYMSERLARLETQADRERVRSAIERDRFLYEQIIKGKEGYEELGGELRRLVQVFGRDNVTVEEKRLEGINLAILTEDLLKIVQSLQVIQVGERVELLSLEPFDLPMDECVAIGLENRLDLMNVKAQVMDARRQVEIAANALEGVLDLRFSGDISTPPGGNRPFDFRKEFGRLRAGLAFTAPLDQIAERNDYRTALIQYQRARREYIDFRDTAVVLPIRTNWRQLHVARQNFEISRQNIRISALQYDQAVEQATAPGQVGGGGGGSRGLNLSRALSDLLNASDDLVQTWLAYERNRLNIYFNMDIMEIDPRGVWTDDFYQQLAAPQSHSDIPPDEAEQVPAPELRNDGPALDPPGAAAERGFEPARRLGSADGGAGAIGSEFPEEAFSLPTEAGPELPAPVGRVRSSAAGGLQTTVTR